MHSALNAASAGPRPRGLGFAVAGFTLIGLTYVGNDPAADIRLANSADYEGADRVSSLPPRRRAAMCGRRGRRRTKPGNYGDPDDLDELGHALGPKQRP